MRTVGALRKLIGFIVAPIQGLLLIILFGISFEGVTLSLEDAALCLGFLYLVQTLLGIPLGAIFERREIVRATSYCLGGAMIVLTPIVAILLLAIAIEGSAPPPLGLLQMLGLVAVAGATMGISYWIIVRPDRKFRVDTRHVSSIFR